MKFILYFFFLVLCTDIQIVLLDVINYLGSSSITHSNPMLMSIGFAMSLELPECITLCGP